MFQWREILESLVHEFHQLVTVSSKHDEPLVQFLKAASTPLYSSEHTLSMDNLAQYSMLMSQVIHAQSMLTAVKRSGRSFEELDEWLIMFAGYSDKLVELMNERLQNLPPLEHGSTEIP